MENSVESIFLHSLIFTFNSVDGCTEHFQFSLEVRKILHFTDQKIVKISKAR